MRTPKSKIYRVWCGMRERCNNKAHKGYSRYGGRGIFVCERWNSFANFLEDMGLPPEGYTLDRIDNDGPYCKENCRWATYFTQAANRSNNVFVALHGETMILAEAARRLQVEQGAIAKWCRIRKLSIQDAVDWYSLHEGGKRPRSIPAKEVFINGVRMSLAEAAEVLGIPRHRIVCRASDKLISHQQAVDWYISRQAKTLTGQNHAAK